MIGTCTLNASALQYLSICSVDGELPLTQVAIEPKTKADLDKMGNGLYKLAQEDPSFHFLRDDETNQTVIEVRALCLCSIQQRSPDPEPDSDPDPDPGPDPNS